MKEYKVISGQLIFSYFSKFALLAFNLGLFSVLTRYLSKEEYGIVSIFFVTIMLVSIAICNGLPEFIIKEYSGLGHKLRVKRFSTLLSFVLILSACVTFIAFLISTPLITFFNLQNYSNVIIYILLTILLFPSYRLFTSYLTAKQKIKSTECVSLLDNSWMLIVIGTALFLGYVSVFYIFQIRFVFHVIALLFVVYLLRRTDKIRLVKPDKRVLKKALDFSLPMLPLLVAVYFINAGDRYILAFLKGSAAVGSYAYFYSLLSIVLLLAMLPTAMLFTYSAREFKKNKAKSDMFFNVGVKYSLLLLIPALIGLYVLRQEIVTLITGPKYVDDLYLLIYLLVFPLFEYFVFLYRKIFLLIDRTKFLAKIYIGACLLNIILNFMLIPYIGIVGAALATIISYLLLSIIMIKKGKGLVKWNYSFMKIRNIIISAVIMGIIISFIHPEYAVTKILTIVFGAGIYFALLFLSNTFVQDEIKLVKSILESRPLSKRLSKIIFR